MSENKISGDGRILRVPLTDGAVRNGYIHFPLSQSIFPSTSYGDSAGQKKGTTVRIVDEFGGDYVDDVRVDGNTARLRARFGKLFKTANAREGSIAEIQEVAAGEYLLRILSTTSQEQPVSATGAPEIYSEKAPMPETSATPSNVILYGPPGTGKTHTTSEWAVRCCDGVLPEDGSHTAIRKRFEALSRQGDCMKETRKGVV